MRAILLLALMIIGTFGYSQTNINGNVVDQNNDPIPGANIVIVGKTIGTVTDFDGNFNLATSEVPPFKIEISSIGYTSTTENITSASQTITITLNESQTFLDEVVISASRTPERIFESPVTVERIGVSEIKNSTAADFYGGLENLKGVDVNTNSLTFKSVNTRGFASFANTRFMQLVDGMDNSTPALNFPIGNLVGLVEPDVLSVELLPGASSALYGANAFNGILFMRSKSPFDYEGISVSIKQGITSQKASGDNSYTDFGIRAAHKFSDKFAAKVNFGYLKGTDWAANNTDDRNTLGGTRDNLNYDGINVYGDEVSTNIKEVALTLEGLGILPSGANALVPSEIVSRTGYNESDLTNYNAESIKADWGLYYRPIEDNSLELSYVGKVGTGNTIYQGTNRYNIAGFFQEQHKLEIRNDNFFVRGYVVSDKAGDSYDMVFTGININRSWKDDNTWFGEYTGAYVQATLGGATDAQAHAAARAQAESGRLLPGTPEFEAAFNKVIKDPDLSVGSQFYDQSKYYHADANYNFSHLIDWAEIQVGGSFREYSLNSLGTIYTDSEEDGPIDYSEFGIYSQVQKTLPMAGEKSLKLTGSLRYDKSEFFDGFYSPRLSAGFTLNRNHNIRASAQTGFRNPTTQDLFIGLDAGRAILVGSAPDNLEQYSRDFDVSATGQLLGQPSSVTQTGAAAYNNSYSAASATALGQTGDPSVLEVANPDLVKPEKVTSFEIGYRGKVDKFVIDFSTYYNSYEDFISQEVVVAPFYGEVGDGGLSVAAIANGDFQAYSTYTNTDANVNSYGASIGLDVKVLGNFDLGGSYTFTKLDFDRDANPDVMLNFNTPEHKFKASFGNKELFENFGFNVSYRFSDDYYWEATFGNGVIPEFHVVDAQINYDVPSIKSTFKLGGTNLTNKEYYTAFGTGYIGSMYYLSWTINN
ncbi:TonB-dependent receptor [Maribacter stanieri]|jgi:outer membrane receptor protein involved in Fe transport|uniref:Outer membrane receptor proteins, mostly Fe transport n=1 Tax=Maribacter stanieri TaxID=440514 RepID=A0A1I6HJJ8_9FLAO|nr:TonB-dependent receptor [Maribacter stanieri]SFR54586.1 Outer membrane receptor proteins, mostly Fe transport [Maribacter stanieri]|tara:strand:- start:318 stop:3107 length:2790 start_codon:yes stop_codon:yes gene_type:complete